MRIVFQDLIFDSYVMYDTKLGQATRWYRSPEDLEAAVKSPQGPDWYEHNMAKRQGGLGQHFADKTRWTQIGYLDS